MNVPTDEPVSRSGLLALMVISVLFSAPLNAGNQSESSGSANAQVVKPVRVIALADLSFGSVAVDRRQEGTVTISPDRQSASYSNAVTASCKASTLCTPHPADFLVTGQSERAYSVTLPAQVKAMGMRTGIELIVDALEMRSQNHPNVTGGGRLDQDGKDRFFIGGTLRVPAGTIADVFRASFPVTVSYE